MLNRPSRPRAQAGPGDASGRPPLDGAPGAARPVLDPLALGRLIELDPKGENRLLERVLQAFKTSVVRLRPQLEAGRRSGDRDAIRLVAHTLKSSSASIGAIRLSRLSSEIEAALRLESPDDAEPMLDGLGGALDEALQAIDALLKARA